MRCSAVTSTCAPVPSSTWASSSATSPWSGTARTSAPTCRCIPTSASSPSATVNVVADLGVDGARSLFADAGITGLVGIDITPELALKVAEAYGSLLPKGGHVVVTRDTSRAARMVKRAMVAGLERCRHQRPRPARRLAGGQPLHDAEDSLRWAASTSPSSPGEAQSLEIRFFDKNGLDIAPAEQKKIERLYFRGEFRRAFFDEVGEIIYPPRPLEYYTAALDEAIESSGTLRAIGARSWRTWAAERPRSALPLRGRTGCSRSSRSTLSSTSSPPPGAEISPRSRWSC